MAALFQLLNYIDQKNAREQEMKFNELKMEAYKRSMGRMAVEEGKAQALKEATQKTTDEFLTSKNTFEKLQAEVDVLSRNPNTAPETLGLYNNAMRSSRADYEANKLKLQKLNSEIKINAGTILNKNQRSFLDDIMEEKDPYEAIKQTQTTTTEDTATGAKTETTQEGPVSAFRNAVGSNAYMPTYNTTSGSLFGNTLAGGAYEEPTPEFAYQPVRDQGGVVSEEDAAGTTAVDPMATQPNPNPVASQMTNPTAPAPKIGDFIRVRNKATGETGTLPSANARAAIASGRFEQVP